MEENRKNHKVQDKSQGRQSIARNVKYLKAFRKTDRLIENGTLFSSYNLNGKSAE